MHKRDNKLEKGKKKYKIVLETISRDLLIEIYIYIYKSIKAYFIFQIINQKYYCTFFFFFFFLIFLFRCC